MTTIPSTSQISPASERVYHQSNLLGEWKGTSKENNQQVEFKVINIRGAKAQVEYTHNGRTERGFADVNGSTITFGNVTIATRNGQKAAMEFSAGPAKWTAILDKQASTADQNKLVGSWAGYSAENGHSASFTVLSLDGRDAQVRYTLNGVTHQGTGTVYKNTVMFQKAQITSDDGKTGTVLLQVGRQSLPVSVKKLPTSVSSSSSSVNKVA